MEVFVISSDAVRGYIDLMILCILSEQDSYGYEISKRISAKTNGTYSIKETTLYSAFTRLESCGHISSYYGTESGGKRRTYYHVTPEGYTFYYEKCMEWKQTKEVVDLFVHTDADQGKKI
jgi:PadR family transcriptional regulator, regulatory protein PadR